MKAKQMLFFLIVLIGCNQNQKNNESLFSIETKKQKVIVTKKEHNELKEEYCFDNTIIPNELVAYINTNHDDLRIPEVKDYDKYYFQGQTKNKIIKSLPYFCSGFFNNDTLIDFALVLIRDSMYHFVYSFHNENESFKEYLLDSLPLASENDTINKYVAFNISTETDRVLEAIDTTYRINSDAIEVSNIFESRTHLKVWDEKKNKYVVMVFD